MTLGTGLIISSGAHSGNELHHYYRQDLAPTASDPLQVGDLWSDTTANLLKRCTNLSPITFTSVEGIFLTTSHDIDAWISGAAMKGTATAGAGDADNLPETRELATNDVNIDFMAFDQTTAEHAFFQWAIPTGWNEGTITYIVYWTAASGSGTFTASLKALARGNDDPLDTAFGTAVAVTDTLLATDDVHISPESAALTVGGTPAEGDIVFFDLSRDIADTLSGDAQVLGIKITYTRNSYTD